MIGANLFLFVQFGDVTLAEYELFLELITKASGCLGFRRRVIETRVYSAVTWWWISTINYMKEPTPFRDQNFFYVNDNNTLDPMD